MGHVWDVLGTRVKCVHDMYWMCWPCLDDISVMCWQCVGDELVKVLMMFEGYLDDVWVIEGCFDNTLVIFW